MCRISVEPFKQISGAENVNDNPLSVRNPQAPSLLPILKLLACGLAFPLARCVWQIVGDAER